MKVAAAVLAAGDSSRLGHPKQLLAHRGSTLVREAVKCALTACDDVAVVLGSRADDIAIALDGSGVHFIANFAWRTGLASSVGCATAWAERLGADALVLLVCDQPRLTGSHVRALVDTHRTTHQSVASRYSGRLGVPAILGRERFRELLALVGDEGARTLIARDPTTIAIDWPDGAFDIDEPGHLVELARHGSAGSRIACVGRRRRRP